MNRYLFKFRQRERGNSFAEHVDQFGAFPPPFRQGSLIHGNWDIQSIQFQAEDRWLVKVEQGGLP